MRWLRTYGPGTLADIKWWTGWTVRATKGALAAIDATEIDLDGDTGYLLADDLNETDPVEPWVALLPMILPSSGPVPPMALRWPLRI